MIDKAQQIDNLKSLATRIVNEGVAAEALQNSEGKCCVVGRALQTMGVNLQKAINDGMLYNYGSIGSYDPKYRELLESAYGLSLVEWNGLQGKNDCKYDLNDSDQDDALRKQRIVGMLHGIILMKGGSIR